MVGWLETAVGSLDPLPKELVESLKRIGDLDHISREKALQIQKEENELLEQIKSDMKEGKNINQEQIKKQADELVQRTAELVSSMDQQIDISQDMYTKVNGCIDNLDENVKSLNALLASRSAKRGADVPIINLNSMDDTFDPSSEPLYCTCRRMQFGKMVGCESEDCKIEWFHYGCVGLIEEPEVWYCSDCCARLNLKTDGTPSEIE